MVYYDSNHEMIKIFKLQILFKCLEEGKLVLLEYWNGIL